MVEQPSRKRRIVRRAVMVIGGIALPLASYVCTYGALCWYSGYQWRSGAESNKLAVLFDSVFYPLASYEESNLPGARMLGKFDLWCYMHGQGSSPTWGEVPDLRENQQHQ